MLSESEVRDLLIALEIIDKQLYGYQNAKQLIKKTICTHIQENFPKKEYLSERKEKLEKDVLDLDVINRHLDLINIVEGIINE